MNKQKVKKKSFKTDGDISISYEMADMSIGANFEWDF